VPVLSASFGRGENCLRNAHRAIYDRKNKRVRYLTFGDTRLYLELEIRGIQCRRFGKVKQVKFDTLANNQLYTKRFVFYVGERCGTLIEDAARELCLGW
jgi:hypothetical protein